MYRDGSTLAFIGLRCLPDLAYIAFSVVYCTFGDLLIGACYLARRATIALR